MQLWLIPAFPLAGFLVNGLFGKRFSKTAVNAVAVGSVAGGLWLSCLLDFPSGATIVLLLSFLYLLTTAGPWVRSLKKGS